MTSHGNHSTHFIRGTVVISIKSFLSVAAKRTTRIRKQHVITGSTSNARGVGTYTPQIGILVELWFSMADSDLPEVITLIPTFILICIVGVIKNHYLPWYFTISDLKNNRASVADVASCELIWFITWNEHWFKGEKFSFNRSHLILNVFKID